MTILLALAVFAPRVLPLSATWIPGQPLPVVVQDATSDCVLTLRSQHDEWISERIPNMQILDATSIEWGHALSADGAEHALETLVASGPATMGIWCGPLQIWSGMISIGPSPARPYLPAEQGRPAMRTIEGLSPDLLVSDAITVHHIKPASAIARRVPDALASPVPWDEAVAHADMLSRLEGLPACYANAIAPADCLGYRLPTEDEWKGLHAASTRGDFAFRGSDWEWTNTVGEHWAYAYRPANGGFAGASADRHFRGHDGPYTHEKDVGFRLVRRWPRCGPGTWDVTCRPID